MERCSPVFWHEEADMADEMIRKALADTIRLSSLSRDEIAERMGAYLGCEVSVSQLNAWTAESKGGYRFPLAYLPAFCRAVGSSHVLAQVARSCGLYVIAEEEYRIFELGKIEQQERLLAARKRVLQKELQRGSELGSPLPFEPE
jgi:hypothetical protein